MKPFPLAFLGLSAFCLAQFASSSAQNAPVSPPYGAPAVAISTLKVDWQDTKRARSVPATLHFPTSSAKAFAKALPLLIISHGNGGTRDGLDYVGKFWASHGYVCAQIQHAGSDANVWRGQANPKEALKGSMRNREAINATSHRCEIRHR